MFDMFKNVATRDEFTSQELSLAKSYIKAYAPNEGVANHAIVGSDWRMMISAIELANISGVTIEEHYLFLCNKK